MMGNQHKPLKKQVLRYILSVSGLLLITIILAGCFSSEDASSQSDDFTRQIFLAYPDLKEKKYETAIVKRVVDGDTFETDAGDKVRLIGVNTPETYGQAEYYGKEASEFTKQRLTGAKVYMFADTGDTDRYGRLLRYIFIDQDPVMFNETLVAEGYANVMTVPPNVMYAEQFVALEREARENNRGLWNEAGNNKSQSKQTSPSQKEQAKQNEQSKEDQQPYPCADPKIKGNINSKKEKIYHVPGSRYYDSTVAEEMFCTEEQAVAAGYRKPKAS